MQIILSLKNISKNFKQGRNNLSVLKNINFNLFEKQSVSLMGSSGSGKTTLLQIAGLLDSQDSGVVECMTEVVQNSESKKTELRKKYFGFIYQFHYLLNEFNAIENVMIAQRIKGEIKEKKAKETLERLGLSNRMQHFPYQLSGGEQQRVAIARAIASNPKIILADEPTGNLDNDTSNEVFNDLMRIVREENASLFIVTHNADLASRVDVSLKLDHGVVNYLNNS